MTKIVTTSKQYADSFNVPHRSILNAIERMRKNINERPNEIRGASYMDENFVSSVHTVGGRDYHCYGMTMEACNHILMYLRGKQFAIAKEQLVRQFSENWDMIRKNYPENSSEMIQAMNKAFWEN